jgi:undecaprenyl-diphosphatase
MRTLTTLNNGVSPKAIVPAAWITTILLRRREGAAIVGIGTSLAVLTANVLKHYITRRRPRLIDRAPLQSFPSGHSAASTAYLASLASVAPREGRPLAIAGALIGAMGVNTIRVLAREHWLGDVIAGDVVGLLAVAGGHLLWHAVTRLAEGTSSSGGGVRA